MEETENVTKSERNCFFGLFLVATTTSFPASTAPSRQNEDEGVQDGAHRKARDAQGRLFLIFF